jgi:malate synthase
MDEERRTSANLAACILAVKDRIVFINTGFLESNGRRDAYINMLRGHAAERRHETSIGSPRTGITTCRSAWLAGLRIGRRSARGCAPDRMTDAQKIDHPRTGATTAWVPPATAATLHATHYHEVDMFAQQAERMAEPRSVARPLADAAARITVKPVLR